MAEYIVEREGMSLDLCCWLHYCGGKQDVTELPEGTVERVLAANSQAAWWPLHLPLGARIEMPDLPTQSKNQVVRIWD